ncbi:MAG TPA: multiheme c-type cytochrome [Candidatus Solibacter sp.]|nr:multiheme c-type cytochrome [Candidatus Solibacter sp.]
MKDKFASDIPWYRPPGFRFQFVRVQGALLARADDGVYTTTIPMEWAFGAGVQAVTFVSRADASHHIEHAFTYYPRAGAWDLTPRHDRLQARTLHQAMGQALPTRRSGLSIVNCFQCHSTGPVRVNTRGEVEVQEAGVHCEACHGPAAAHVKAGAKMAKTPRSGTEVNELCGRCHRSEEERFDWDSVWNIRHQPPYLARSRCFTQGNLSCLTCHDPHDPVRRSDAAYYRQRCQTCHTKGDHAQAATDCVTCHMPVVQASARLAFHNHQIKR